MKATIKEIVENDLCIGCGVCISESKSSKMILNNKGFWVPKIDNSFNEMAVKVCPFNPNPEKEVQDEDKLSDIFINNYKFKHNRIGKYNNVFVGYSNEYRETSSSGGVATYILEFLLKEKIVDHLFVVGQKDDRYGYQWISDVRDLEKISKTRYYPVNLEGLFEHINNKVGKIAIVGIPPFLKAIRLKQYYYPEYQEKIKFLIAIISGGVKGTFFTEYLAQKSGINGKFYNPEYRLKNLDSTAIDYSFGAFDSNNIFRKVRMQEVGNMWGTGMFNCTASDFSDDVTGELSDITLGDAWINPYRKDGKGHNVILTRSELADFIINEGIKRNELIIENIHIDSFIESQAGAFRHRQMAMKSRLNYFKSKNNLIPFKRKRLLENIPIEYKLVQKQRLKVRNRSIALWLKYKDAALFDNNIKNDIKTLKVYTKIYHKVQIIKKKLGIKSM
ncbi:Coenzyme F420-reducing hydrogenase, beta subunit [Chryseobacterium taichungense]|uniref:Coenzyme F420-reducing hydrogenase, beta subunit n=1 Tax=Chryseobacterium taichungense TaxID=295069 RepID=A0A1H7YD38_9FLAO|nr:Coenzyme F420 hydrogenase/dehydrogenase, beta subunit C-terminal domain [Chryseobacterium taichungense]SEM43875.1 Coenzyme F420-reducing hydrogenase, beta subunit [Chryseobacterium taichungense]